jgi:hypothetical protein
MDTGDGNKSKEDEENAKVDEEGNKVYASDIAASYTVDGKGTLQEYGIEVYVKGIFIGRFVHGYNFWLEEAQEPSKCWTCLDPSTLHKNLLGLSYPGGNNPKSFNGLPSYSYVPYSKAEYPAIGHDRRYDNLDAKGATSLLFDTRLVGADLKFVLEEFQIAFNPRNSNEHEKLDAFILGIGLGAASSLKTIYLILREGSSAGAYIGMWYGISNVGVTNNPSR